ncbi:hypothetical protein HEB94_002439 [Actinopolymorpha pittospori]|uniref:Uncharacterized protein n=1 Tax=Actinopolymorpha pittospori TaxID=648752 RepID=A0A927MSM5_9ACTN|nr:hypothetical protein [Actinopolymorpha pittospori]
MTPREAMDGALKDAITQHLRPKGFTGSLPHLRRRSDAQVCLISFQFFQLAEGSPSRSLSVGLTASLPPGASTRLLTR